MSITEEVLSTGTGATESDVAEINSAVNAAIELIRPALQADGGDIILRGVEGGVVTVELVGACGGCPLSTQTMKGGVERIIKEKVPGIREVIAL